MVAILLQGNEKIAPLLIWAPHHVLGMLINTELAYLILMYFSHDGLCKSKASIAK